MVYAVRIHTEGDAGVMTQVASLHSSPEGARKALVARLEAVAGECYGGGYRAAVVWDSSTVAEVLELDSFNIVRGHTDWSGDVLAMSVEP
jgi:hypothetical protein